MRRFTISHLDHVAIRVKDLERSARWYEEMLGLKRVQYKEWGPYPIFMMAGTTGVALFPQKMEPTNAPVRTTVDHFAFFVEPTQLEDAKKALHDKGIKTHFQDHVHYHSIYFKDLDGHQLEITTLAPSVS